jgi:hypothetical protein
VVADSWKEKCVLKYDILVTETLAGNECQPAGLMGLLESAAKLTRP